MNRTKFLLILLLTLVFLLPPSGSAQAKTTQPASFPYVAIGDSLTTGSSSETCRENRTASPWGCTEYPNQAVNYPNRVAVAAGFKHSIRPKDYLPAKLKNAKFDLYRAGIWGYTVHDAVIDFRAGHNQAGPWLPQLQVASQATQLVTGNLGINDLHFSDVSKWARLYLSSKNDRITPEVKRILAERSSDFNALFNIYKSARRNGATVITTLYYNPYSNPSGKCRELNNIGNRMVNTLDDELQQRAAKAGLKVADFRRSFAGHGAGTKDSYVVGKHCSISGVINAYIPDWLNGYGGNPSVASVFDPHPNNNGTIEMAKLIMEQYNGAD